ncbi:rhsD element protein, partial [Escherichia coli]
GKAGDALPLRRCGAGGGAAEPGRPELPLPV